MKIEGRRIDSDFWQFEVYVGDERYDFPVYHDDPATALQRLLDNKNVRDFLRGVDNG